MLLINKVQDKIIIKVSNNFLLNIIARISPGYYVM